MEPLQLRVNGEDFEATPRNTSLFTFIGEAALYDHCFLITNEEETRAIGAYVFKALDKDAYDVIAAHIKRQHYPQHLNMLIAPQCDRDAFDHRAFGDLGDTVPDGWT